MNPESVFAYTSYLEVFTRYPLPTKLLIRHLRQQHLVPLRSKGVVLARRVNSKEMTISRAGATVTHSFSPFPTLFLDFHWRPRARRPTQKPTRYTVAGKLRDGRSRDESRILESMAGNPASALDGNRTDPNTGPIQSSNGRVFIYTRIP